MVPEAPLEETEHGLVCKGDGWFVVNAREVETDQENFLVLSGKATLLVEGEERPSCVVLAVGARDKHVELGPDGRLQGREDGGDYTIDDTAIRHGAGIEPGTSQDDASAPFGPVKPRRYGGLL